mmetsp:Transcript_26680/g.61393  ORF Transcript_26680/g.61393 Transcript_26680/m.61393 type:complete len:141 (+) Transcript_26680:66-488(+)
MQGPLQEAVCAELNAMLTETRYMALCDTLEAWQKDTNKPREGVLALERMVKAGPVPQTFDWPHMEEPPSNSMHHLLGRQSATSVASEPRVPRRSNTYSTPSKPEPTGLVQDNAAPVQSAMMAALDAIDPERRQQLLEQTV